MMRDEPPAFRLWLNRDLRQRYGAVQREPIPDELLSLVERMPLRD